jgi:hypothetical protein
MASSHGVYRATVQGQRKEATRQLRSAERTLASLGMPNSRYAKEIKALVVLYARTCDVWRQAPDELEACDADPSV